ncbi:MAG: aromatic acid exporter family protein [Bacillota bacterium]|nr:aromatic acid exporter family protein [Bacillota bacterium]MDP4161147.1 aromatic acid exporter family protein [Bacillota bacterium]
MRFGWRIIKTGIAVTLCVFIAHLLHLEYPFYSAIASVIALQATMADSYTQGINRLKGTLVGAITGYLFALVSVNNPIWIGFGVVVTFVILKFMRWHEAMNTSSVMFIAITLNLEGNPLNYAVNRLVDTALGIIIAFLVNWLVAPPKYRDEVEDTFDEARDQVIKLYRQAFRTVLEPGKSVDKEAIQDFEDVIKRAKKLVTLSRKEHLWGKTDEAFRLIYVEPVNRLERMSFAVEQILTFGKGWARPFSKELQRDLTKLSSQSYHLLSLITETNPSVAPSICSETNELIVQIHDRLDLDTDYAGLNKILLLELLHWVQIITEAASSCLHLE